MENNPIWQFLKEIVVRLRAKSPVFFKILQYISLATTLIPGIPMFLTYVGVTLPDFLVAIQDKAIVIAGIVATFLTGLPVDKDPAVEVTPADQPFGTSVIKKEECPALPFSDNVDKDKK